MVGTNQIAEASVGYDLATQQQLSTEERIQRGAAGTAAVAFTVAGGMSTVANPEVALAGAAEKTATAEVATAEVATAEVATAEAAAVEGAAAENAGVQAIKPGPCFAAGTPLRTPDGSKPIDSFQEGELLLSRHEDDPEGPVIAKRVLKVFQTYAPLLDLHVGGRVIRTTAEHPFWVAGRGWVAAQQGSKRGHRGSKRGHSAFMIAHLFPKHPD
jgi:Pre-toxin TG